MSQSARATIGIDVGGTKILFALYDERFRAVEEIKIRTPVKKDFDRVLVENVRTLLRAAKKASLRPLGVGVGCAGTVDYARQRLRFSPNLPFLKDYSFAETLANAAGKARVFLGNDVHLGLYGEQQLGAAAGLRHVIGVFFGTGVGGAVMIDGRLYLGASGAAGEIGHCLVSPMGHLTDSERKGVLDDLVSRPAIAGEAAAISAKRGAPRLHALAGADVKRIRAETLARSIREGDKNIEEMVRSRVRMAGIALSNLVDFFNPEMVVLGGGLVEAMPALFAREISRGVRAHTVRDVRKTVKIAVGALKAHSVAVGAAKIALDRRFLRESRCL